MFTLFCIIAFTSRTFHFTESSQAPVEHHKLRYAITENQPDDLHIGKLDDDLQQNPDKQSTELVRLLQSPQRRSLRFKLRDPSTYFHLHEITSVLITIQSIDLELLCPRYCPADSHRGQLHLFVNIWLDRQVQATVSIEVTVLDVDDNEPRFPPTVPHPYILKLKEVLYRSGMQIQLPRAVDDDVQPEHAQINYRLESHPDDVSQSLDTFHLFAKNDSRLMLELQRDLDYETASFYRFFLVASPHRSGDHSNWRSYLPTRNEKLQDQLEVRIEVVNINDIEPVFSSSVYSVDIPEDTPIGSVIFTLSATDADINSTINYSLEYGSDADLKALYKVEPDGKIVLQGNLDYESRRQFSLPVRASDGEFFALARVEVTIADVNDELPQVVTSPTVLTVRENQPVRTLVGQLLVIDRDSVAVNGQVECREPDHLAGQQPLLFLQNENTDPNAGHKVSDVARRIARSYTGDLVGSLQTVGNMDATVHQRYMLYTRMTFDREAAVGQAKYDSLLICWDGISIRDEVRHKSLTTTLSVALNVEDINDNPPVFEQQYYEAEIKENCPLGTRVLQVHANDADSEPQYQPHYRLKSDELFESRGFSVEPQTGWIVTTGDIDRETQAVHQLTILAVDGPTSAPDSGNSPYTMNGDSSSEGIGGRHTATAHVQIRLLDENDNAPEFRGPRQFAIEENRGANVWIGNLQAVDRDDELNQVMEFVIPDKSSEEMLDSEQEAEATHRLPPPIRLTSNGSLFATSTLDRENQSYYCLEVMVRDSSSADALSTTDTFCVRVLDVNDNKPYFTKIRGSLQDEYAEVNITKLVSSNMVNVSSEEGKMKKLSESKTKAVHFPEDTVYVSRRENPGYCALIAEATDADDGRNAQLIFSSKFMQPKIKVPLGSQNDKIGNMNDISDAFHMEPVTGRLILTRSLQHTEFGPHSLVLTVRDSGDPPLSMDKNINLVISDQPPKGNWLLPDTEQEFRSDGVFDSDASVSNTVLKGIILSGFSTLLVTVLITAILCLIKPCRKSRLTRPSMNRIGGKRRKGESAPSIIQPIPCLSGESYGYCDVGYTFQRPASMSDGYISAVNTKFNHSSFLIPNSTNVAVTGINENQLFLSGDPCLTLSGGFPFAIGNTSEIQGGSDGTHKDSCVLIAPPHTTNFNTSSSATLASDSTWLPNIQQNTWSLSHSKCFPCNNTCPGDVYHLPTEYHATTLLAPETGTSLSSPSHHRNNHQQQHQQQQKPKQPLHLYQGCVTGNRPNDTGRLACGDQCVTLLSWEQQALQLGGGGLDRQQMLVEAGRVTLPEGRSANVSISGCGGVREPGIVGVLGEEQRSDSGRGGSDDEVSNQRLTPVTKPLLVNCTNNGTSNNHKFRSATVRNHSSDRNGGYVLSGLTYPSLARGLPISTERSISTFGQSDKHITDSGSRLNMGISESPYS